MSPMYLDGKMNEMGVYLKKLSILSFQIVEMTVKCLKWQNLLSLERIERSGIWNHGFQTRNVQ